MQISDVRKRVLQTIERAKQAATDRRGRVDKAEAEYHTFLDEIAVPVFRQIANVLRAEGVLFNVFTPGGSVRLMSDRSAEDYIELGLETSGGEPRVVGRASRSHGRRVTATEHPLGGIGSIRDLTEEEVLEFVLRELAPFVER